MTYKEFCEEAEIEYTLFVTINGEDSIRLKAYDLDSLIEQTHKLDKAVADKLTEQFEDLAEDYEQWRHATPIRIRIRTIK